MSLHVCEMLACRQCNFIPDVSIGNDWRKLARNPSKLVITMHLKNKRQSLTKSAMFCCHVVISYCFSKKHNGHGLRRLDTDVNRQMTQLYVCGAYNESDKYDESAMTLMTLLKFPSLSNQSTITYSMLFYLLFQPCMRPAQKCCAEVDNI
jgi:hypothetical protein